MSNPEVSDLRAKPTNKHGWVILFLVAFVAAVFFLGTSTVGFLYALEGSNYPGRQISLAFGTLTLGLAFGGLAYWTCAAKLITPAAPDPNVKVSPTQAWKMVVPALILCFALGLGFAGWNGMKDDPYYDPDAGLLHGD